MRGGGGGRSQARQNAVRSGVVVLGSLAFGYLSYCIGFKPYLDRAQEAMDSQSAATDASNSGAAQPDHPRGDDLAPSEDPAVVLRD